MVVVEPQWTVVEPAPAPAQEPSAPPPAQAQEPAAAPPPPPAKTHSRIVAAVATVVFYLPVIITVCALAVYFLTAMYVFGDLMYVRGRAAAGGGAGAAGAVRLFDNDTDAVGAARRCPAALNGVQCGFHGHCDYETGACVCGVLWGGRACDATACPGYDPATGRVCGGRGLCSPFFTRADLAPECDPARGGSWSDPGCVDAVAWGRRFKTAFWAAHEAVGESPRMDDRAVAAMLAVTGHVPECVCFGSAEGEACELDAAAAGDTLESR